jgi:hypothetical protein
MRLEYDLTHGSVACKGRVARRLQRSAEAFVKGDRPRGTSRFFDQIVCHTSAGSRLPGMKKNNTLASKKNIHLQSETIRVLRQQDASLVVGGLKGSTVPRSWCESCETAC